MSLPVKPPSLPKRESSLPPRFDANLPRRHGKSRVWRSLFLASTVVGIFFLVLLLFNISDASLGYAALEYQVHPDSLAVNGIPLEQQDIEALISLIQKNVSSGLLRQLEREKPLAAHTQAELYGIVLDKVARQEIVRSWSLWDSIFRLDAIRAELASDYPQAELHFRSWLSPQFLSVPQSSNPLQAGIRTALLGSIWTVGITILVAFPLGVGAALYLEEYAQDNRLNRLIQTNINNLAGVPSIIYGMLGLAVFVRTLEPLSSGTVFGLSDPATANGRTILSAGLTLALLVLPLIIINAQEAVRAVPGSLRQASYGLGATKWQTVWYHVLPNAVPGILTGTILAISRAIGETAPLVVVGAATYITFDPGGPFSSFTTLPIQIYQWTARPQAEFRNLAGAAILALLALLLSLNAVAILLRNRFRRQGGN